MGLTSVLNFPAVYNLFSFMVNDQKIRSVWAETFIKAKSGDRILDIGCGPANMLNYLPENIEYVGFDMDPNYIDFAKKKYGNRGKFFCDKVTESTVAEQGYFDIVIVFGVLHHLTDDESQDLFKLAKKVLKKNGRIVTLDGCYRPGQSMVEKWILGNDRGKFIRTEDGYRNLAVTQFENVQSTKRNDLNRLPYTYNIMVCEKTSN